MKTIYFLRHGKLNLPYENHAAMPIEILADLASGKNNPGIDEVATLKLIENFNESEDLQKCNQIFHSESRRSHETAILFSNFLNKKYEKPVKLTQDKRLNEIRFTLDKFLDSEKPTNMKKINEYVIGEMINGRLSGDVDKKQKEIIDFLNQKFNGSCLVITHGFTLNIIENIVKNNNKEFNLSKLRDNKNYEYIEGVKRFL